MILAVLFDERHAAWAADRLAEHAPALRMSTVNLTEVLIVLRDRQPQQFEALERRVLESGIRFVAPDADQARIAAEARGRMPLNLGDCFAYALAAVEGCPILTVDADFARLDHPVLLPNRA